MPADDPFGPARETYDRALADWSKAMEQMVASEEFAAASGEFITRYAEMQESVRAAYSAAAESVNLPTNEDLARVATLVVNVERKVDEMADEVHAMAARLASIEAALGRLAPPRTK